MQLSNNAKMSVQKAFQHGGAYGEIIEAIENGGDFTVAQASDLAAAKAFADLANEPLGPAALDAVGNWSKLAENIDAAKTGVGVSICGVDTSFWTTNYGYIQNATKFNGQYAVRQNCTIKSITIKLYSCGGAGSWKIKVLRWAGGENYTCVGEATFAPVIAAGVLNRIDTFSVADGTLSNDLPVLEGDILALYVPNVASANGLFMGTDSVYFGKASNSQPKTYAGDIAVNATQTFSNDGAVGRDLALNATSDNPPYAIWLGDSIVGSGNGSVIHAADQYVTDYDNVANIHRPGGSPGNPNYTICRRVASRLPPNFTYQNHSKSGLCLTDDAVGGFQNYILPRAMACNSKIVFIHGGINDLYKSAYSSYTNAQKAAAIITALDVINTAVGPNRVVYLDEILPSPYAAAMDLTKETMIKTVNSAYKTYCDSHPNWNLVKCYDEMSTYNATAKCRFLNPLYASNSSYDGTNSDSVHLSLAGVDKMGAIISSYLLGVGDLGKTPSRAPVTLGTAQQLTTEMSSSTIFIKSTSSRVQLLPDCQGGLEYTFVCESVPSGVGHGILPKGYDKIVGAGLTGIAGTAIYNTQATAVIGDWIKLKGGPLNIWYVQGSVGTWAN